MKKVIAVANPHLIPGGLETVVEAVKKYLPDGQFIVTGTRVLLPYIFRPRSFEATSRAAGELADRAFKLSGIDAPSLGIGFVQGTDGPLFRKSPCIHATAVDNTGFSGAGFAYARGDAITAEDAQDVLSDVLRHRLPTAVTSSA